MSSNGADLRWTKWRAHIHTKVLPPRGCEKKNWDGSFFVPLRTGERYYPHLPKIQGDLMGVLIFSIPVFLLIASPVHIPACLTLRHISQYEEA